MSGLLYREDMDAVRERLTHWWNGGDLGRPALQVEAPRDVPLETIEVMPQPAGWLTHYSTRDFAYRVNLGLRACAGTEYLAEAVPQTSPDLAPNCLALYLGCRGVEQERTVWCEPFIDDPVSADFGFDAANFYWDFTLRLADVLLERGRGKFLVSYPDLIEGLDTLAAMRGTEELLMDLIERPEWVQSSLRRITDLYFQYYDPLYERIRDEAGGSHFWAWAPGRMAKFQCDFSAMIGPAMFGETMVPVLREMCARVDYCMYHWDGPGALKHEAHLFGLDDLDMIQWTPGAAAEWVTDPVWWPLYHRALEAGKKVYVSPCRDLDELLALKREFGSRLKQFLIFYRAPSRAEAEEFIRAAEC